MTGASLSSMKLLRTMPVLAIVAWLSACGTIHGPAVTGTPEGQTGVTRPQESADTEVVDKLAAARCDFEQACKNIGPGAKYASPSACMEDVRGHIASKLNTQDCPRGLDSNAVDRCMAAIRSDECSHPFDTLTRFDTCRATALCMK